jgi:hypothetical protein
MKSKKTFFAVLFAVITMLAASSHIHGLIFVNDLKPVFVDDEGQKSQEIERNVTTGASLFLRAQSQSLLLLNEYELSGIQTFNHKKALEYVENAIKLLEEAWTRYLNAGALGKNLGYYPVKLNVLNTFDYDGFILENQLNKDIAKRLQDYLNRGDIVGIYQQAADDIEAILITLNSIKEHLKAGIKPGSSLFFKLFQQYAESSLFGNYSTMMGSAALNIPIG